MKKILRKSRKIVAILLVISIVSTSTNLQIMAQSRTEEKAVTINNDNHKQIDNNETHISYAEIEKQLKEGTYEGEKIGETEYSDKYAGDNSSTIEVYYENPIRYKDKNGKFKDYNPNLISTENKKAVTYSGNVDADKYSTESYAFQNHSWHVLQYKHDSIP